MYYFKETKSLLYSESSSANENARFVIVHWLQCFPYARHMVTWHVTNRMLPAQYVNGQHLFNTTVNISDVSAWRTIAMFPPYACDKTTILMVKCFTLRHACDKTTILMVKCFTLRHACDKTTNLMVKCFTLRHACDQTTILMVKCFTLRHACDKTLTGWCCVWEISRFSCFFVTLFRYN